MEVAVDSAPKPEVAEGGTVRLEGGEVTPGLMESQHGISVGREELGWLIPCAIT